MGLDPAEWWLVWLEWFNLFPPASCPSLSPLTLVGEDGGEPEFRGKTGSLATTGLSRKAEELSSPSGVLQRDTGAEDRRSARLL